MRSILIVDDSPSVRLQLVALLADAAPGTSIVEAGDAHEAVRAFAAHRPGLVFLDVFLPSGAATMGRITRDYRYVAGDDRPGGLQALERILDLDPGAMVVLITGAEATSPHVEAARSLGVRRVLLKPLRAEDVAASLALVDAPAEKRLDAEPPRRRGIPPRRDIPERD